MLSRLMEEYKKDIKKEVMIEISFRMLKGGYSIDKITELLNLSDEDVKMVVEFYKENENTWYKNWRLNKFTQCFYYEFINGLYIKIDQVRNSDEEENVKVVLYINNVDKFNTRISARSLDEAKTKALKVCQDYIKQEAENINELKRLICEEDKYN